jgi:hypothetical protein
MSDDAILLLFFDGLDVPPAVRGELGARLRRILERERATADNLRAQLEVSEVTIKSLLARLGASERERERVREGAE